MITIKDLRFSYEKEVLKGIDLNIDKGELVTVIGPNGAGKSTLVKSICGLLHNYEGSIKVEGKEVRDYRKKELAKRIAYVQQEQNTEFDFTVAEVIEMGYYSKRKNIFDRGSKDELHKLMEDTETIELKDKSILELSGGEKQRVYIARALAQNSSIILLDEPVSNLDLKHQSSLMKLCSKLTGEMGYTIVTILHDINLASIYSDRILILQNGEVVGYDTPDKLIDKSILEGVYEVEVEVVNHRNHKLILPDF